MIVYQSAYDNVRSQVSWYRRWKILIILPSPQNYVTTSRVTRSRDTPPHVPLAGEYSVAMANQNLASRGCVAIYCYVLLGSWPSAYLMWYTCRTVTTNGDALRRCERTRIENDASRIPS